MSTPTVRVRHEDVPMWREGIGLNIDHSKPISTSRKDVNEGKSGFVTTVNIPGLKQRPGGYWICFCGKKRNTLRSVQKHIKRDH